MKHLARFGAGFVIMGLLAAVAFAVPTEWLMYLGLVPIGVLICYGMGLMVSFLWED